MPLACHGHVLVENYISTRSAHFSTVFFHTCLKLRNRQSGQAVFAWGRDFHTLFHTLWKTGFCGFVAGCRTGVGYDILCGFCIICLVCLLGYLVNRVGLWGEGGWSPADLSTVEPGGGHRGAVACRPCLAGTRRGACLFGRLPTFCFSLLSCPHPPDPLPLRGRGRPKVILCKGLRPLHPRGLTQAALAFLVESGFRRGGFASCGAGWGWRCDARRGAQGDGRRITLPCRNPAGAYLFGRPPAFYFSFNSAPIPPTPFPSGEGGDLKFSYARGFAPCIPGAEPGRHRLLLWKVSSGGGLRLLRGGVGVALRCPAGGAGGAVACRPCHCSTRRGACLFGRPPAFYFSFNSAPIPPTPFPSGEGGD